MANTTATPRVTAKIVSAARTGSAPSGFTIRRQMRLRRAFIGEARCAAKHRAHLCFQNSSAIYGRDLAIAQSDHYIRNRRRFRTVSGHQRGGALFTSEADKQFKDGVAG